MTEYENIKKRCRAVGIDVSKLCIMTGKNRNSLQRWKDENPKSVQILVDLQDKLDELEEEFLKDPEFDGCLRCSRIEGEEI